MLREFRCIVFRRPEVALAATEHLRRRNLVKYNATLRVKEVTVAPLGVEVEECRRDGETRTHTLDEATLTGALILFCRERKIPLPARTNKKIIASDGGIALILASDIPLQEINEMLAAG